MGGLKRTPLNRGTKQLKQSSPLKGKSKLRSNTKKRTEIESTYKEIKKEMSLIKDHVCTGCGSPNQLTHSHIIPRSKGTQYIDKLWNLTYHCVTCHELWESKNIIDMMKLDDFISNLMMIKEKHIEWYNQLIYKLNDLGVVIYCIQNIENRKRYIGSTVKMRQRFLRHFRELNNGTHHSSKLQNQFNKYGYDKFKIVVLEQVSFENIYLREQYWIDHYQPELNIKFTVGQIGINHNTNNKGVCRFNSDTFEFIDRFDSIQAAINALDMKYVTSISEACSGKRKSAYGYLWRYEDDYEENGMIPRLTETSSWIVQCDKIGMVIKTWLQGSVAANSLQIDPSDISGALTGRLKTAGGYVWKRYNDLL